MNKSYTAGTIFFVIVLVELFLGGSGRFFTIGPLTLRMYLYVIMLIIGAYYIFKKRPVNKIILGLVAAFSLTLLLGIALGIHNNAGTQAILTDVKPLIYFYTIVYFYFVITTTAKIQLITKTLTYCALFLALSYIIILTGLLSGVIDFASFYRAASKPSFFNEIIFRNEQGFFYAKSFIFLPIALFFFIFSPLKKNILYALIVLVAAYLTFLRGLMLDVVVTGIVALFLTKIKKRKIQLALLAIFLPIAAITFSYLIPSFTKNTEEAQYLVLGDRSEPDSERVVQIQQVWEQMTVGSLFFGHGFGIGIPSREVHFEITYLEIVHKQGIIGLLFWLLPLLLASYYFFKLKKRDQGEQMDTLVTPYYLAILVIYVQSLTNPYLLNPIGMSITIIALIVLMQVYQQQVETKNYDIRLHTDL